PQHCAGRGCRSCNPWRKLRPRRPAASHQTTGETSMQLRMNGRNALITGGSLGIGRAIAKHFAGAGANVAIVARNQGPLDEAKADIAAQANVKVATGAADVGT